MSSAQREFVDGEEVTQAPMEQYTLLEPGAELKRQVAARLAAHRRRRGAAVATSEVAASEARSARGRQSAIAATVAERYAQTPSYRAFLAEQAKRAMEEAAAQAEVARRNAEAVAAAQMELLGELELWDAPQEFSGETAEVVATGPDTSGALTVRLYEDLSVPTQAGARSSVVQVAPDAAESQLLDAEIAFRKSPVFEDYTSAWDTGEALEGEPPVPLPANLLEFPRQLVAVRKARPRLAEGPLLEDAPRTRQLRIFEVEPEQISTAPVVAAAPEWTTSIRLDAHTMTAPVASEHAPLAESLPPQTAPLALRTMAALVDAGLVLAALVTFVGVFAKVAGQIPVGVPAAIALAGVAAALYLIYQALFFTFSEQTPGMRYARIGLCTFADENPTRAAMRRRILAQIVAACPMGLGLLWTLLDDEGLGWHDRISKMYQRAY